MGLSIDFVGYDVASVGDPTTVLYDDPGVNGAGESYVSDVWSAYVGGSPATVLHYARNTQFAVPGMWDANDTLNVSFLKFATNTPVEVVLTWAGLYFETGDTVHIYPRRPYTIVGGNLVVTVSQNDKLIIYPGTQTAPAGATLQPMVIHALAPLAEPTGTVVDYDGSQTTTVSGQTLRFTGPAVHAIGQRFPLVANSRVHIDGDTLLEGSFHGNGTSGWSITGHGSLTAEIGVTPELVWEIDEFDDKYVYTLIDAAGAAPGYAIGNNTSVSGITLFNSPFYGISNITSMQHVSVLSPWWANSDGVHPVAGATDAGTGVDHCLFMVCDDAIYIGESFGPHTVTNNLICTSAASDIHTGYWPAPSDGETLSLIVNNDIVATQQYYQDDFGRVGGHVIAGFSDGEIGEEAHVIKGYYFESMRVWAPPSGIIRTKFIELSNRLYPWGEQADGIGNIVDFTFKDIAVEKEPIVKSLISGRDADNTPHGLTFTGITFDGVALTSANWSRYFETNSFPYDIVVGLLGVAGQGTASMPAFRGRGRGTVTRVTFDLNPGHGANVLITVGGKTYKVVSVTPYGAGSMNSFMSLLAQAIVGVFQRTRVTITRTQDVYDSTNGTTVPVVSTASVLASPPIPYSWQEVNNSPVLASHMRIIVPSRELDPLVTDAAFYDLQVRL